METVINRVPQGSIMGPTLFLIYINDINLRSFTGKIHPYADDTAIYNSNPNVNMCIENMNNNLKVFTDWAKINSFTINESKTEYLIVTYQSQPKLSTSTLPSIKLNEVTFDSVTKYEYLGIMLSNDLCFGLHISKLIANFQNKIYIYDGPY